MCGATESATMPRRKAPPQKPQPKPKTPEEQCDEIEARVAQILSEAPSAETAAKMDAAARKKQLRVENERLLQAQLALDGVATCARRKELTTEILAAMSSNDSLLETLSAD